MTLGMAAGDAMATTHLFVYGTLVDPSCLDRVLGHRHAGERLAARLAGYERTNVPASEDTIIVPTPGAWVDGVLLMDLSPRDMQALDRYEEVESGIYRRDIVEVEAWGCGPRPISVRANVYAAGEQFEASTSS